VVGIGFSDRKNGVLQMMRKLMFMLMGAALVVALGSTSASGAGRIRCKVPPKHTPPSQRGLYCQNPTVNVGLNVSCRRPGTSFQMQTITASANAGVSRVQVIVRSTPQTVFDKHYPNSPLHVVINGVTISTAGLGTGPHTVTVIVTDARGKRVSKTVHFAVCPPPPPQTTG
jgi:hypothetical protein